MKGLQIVSSLLLLAAFCKADDAEKAAKRMYEISQECAAENELSKEQLESIPNTLCSEEPLDKDLSCHMACIYKKLDVLKDGEIFGDEMQKSILSTIKEEKPKEELGMRLDKCKDEVATISDECEKAAAFSKCLMTGTDICKESNE